MKFEDEYEIRIKHLKSQFLACQQWELYCRDGDMEPHAANARLSRMREEYVNGLRSLQAFVADNFGQFEARKVSSLIAVPTQPLAEDEHVMHRIWLGSSPPEMVVESIRQWACALDETAASEGISYGLALWVWDKRQLKGDRAFEPLVTEDGGAGKGRYALGRYRAGGRSLEVRGLRDFAADCMPDNLELMESLNDTRHFVNISDIFRLEILREFGGIYLDADTMPYKTATLFLAKPEVPDYIYYKAEERRGKIKPCHVSWMNLHRDENGVLIARKNNPAIKKMTAQIGENLSRLDMPSDEGNYYSDRSREFAKALYASSLHDATYGVWQQYIGRTFLSYDDITRAHSVLHDGSAEKVCAGLHGMRLVVDAITNEKVPLDAGEAAAYGRCVHELEKRDWKLDDPLELERIADIFSLDEVPRMAYPPQIRSRVDNCHYYSFLSDDPRLDRANAVFGEYLMKKNAKSIAAGGFWHRTCGRDMRAANEGKADSQDIRVTQPAETERRPLVSFMPGYLLDENHKNRMAKLLFSTSYLEYCSFDNKLKLPLVELQRRQNIDQYLSFTHGMFDCDGQFVGFFTAGTMADFDEVPAMSHYRDEVRPMDEAYDRFVSEHTDGEDFFVSSLAVDDSQRGKGYFNPMLAEIKALARRKGSRRVVLTVWGKSDAFSIYAKKGFHVRGVFDYAYERFFDYLYLMDYDLSPRRESKPLPFVSRQAEPLSAPPANRGSERAYS